MKAMVLAAGLGTRLRPLTNNRPKALVEVGGCTLLEIALARLREFGVREVIVNVHHLADMIIGYLSARNHFGMKIEVSREDILLDTGGGLKKAAWYFLENCEAPEQPFILHNVDVISNIDLSRMVEAHNAAKALVTLAVQRRRSSRYLLFDEKLQLSGRRIGSTGRENEERVRPPRKVQALAFSGIHVISPAIFGKMTEEGVFSIIDCYLRLARHGEPILAFRSDEYRWRDLGRAEDLAKAEREFHPGRLHSH